MAFCVSSNQKPMRDAQSQLTSGQGGLRDSIRVIFVTGAPGAGKGTLCEYAAHKFGYFHISLGDYLRHLVNNPDLVSPEAYAGATSSNLKDTLNRTALLEADIIVGILGFRVRQEANRGQKKFIVDGFPRTVESAKEYERMVGMPSLLLEIDCSKDIAEGRFIGRGRERGDTREKFAKRYAQFLDELPPILERYRAIHTKIDNSGDQTMSFAVMHGILEAQTMT